MAVIAIVLVRNSTPRDKETLKIEGNTQNSTKLCFLVMASFSPGETPSIPAFSSISPRMLAPTLVPARVMILVP
uniref:Uncharacterized protein n=1 Tax=Solanum lycopersicum TaxID=4081 RepID=A0A3Q7EFK0_SOLLC